MSPSVRRLSLTLAVCVAFSSALGACQASGAEPDSRSHGARIKLPLERPLLSPEEWKTLDRIVDRGIVFLAQNQDSDGSFRTLANGQPGVSGLCVMAFLARGHQPGHGPYGAHLERAIDYVLSLQDADSGAIMSTEGGVQRNAGMRWGNTGAHYSHGISGIMLTEVYGMTTAERHERIHSAVVKALAYTRKQQLRPKENPDERGGWRYVEVRSADSDLSVTAWQLMFYRSARNAEFNVPVEWVKEGLRFVHQTFGIEGRTFAYILGPSNRGPTRAMAGAGIICLELSGEHGTEIAREAGDWILQHDFTPYNDYRMRDRYHYGAFYCSQAMFQLGGEYWHRFFPKLLQTLVQAQRPDGSWDSENGRDSRFGNVYTTALTVLALATPYQILPIYQR